MIPEELGHNIPECPLGRDSCLHCCTASVGRVIQGQFSWRKCSSTVIISLLRAEKE
jgi:hypothetical protein